MTVEVRVLGRFEVRRDSTPLPPFPRRDSAALVKLLALAPGRTLRTERAVDLLWPDVPLTEARPRLHKAAHYARRAMYRPDAVVLRGDLVALCPQDDVVVDADLFEAAAATALASAADGRAAACAEVAGRFRGELLPEDAAEPWTEEPRARLHRRRVELLRAAGRWDDLLDLDPADEIAHVALLRQAVVAGDRTGALRRYERLERTLRQELDVAPGAEARALRDRALGLPAAAGTGPPRPRRRPGPPVTQRLVERDTELAELDAHLDGAVHTGRGSVVVLTGEAGCGKTALLEAFVDRAVDRVEIRCGSCDDLLAPRTFGPFRDVAGSAGGELADALARGGDPESVLPALLRLLTRTPSVLAIEDLHWADDATIDAVRYLTRRIRETAALLVLTCREDELDRSHPVRKLLGAFAGPYLRRIPVRPLSVPAVAALAGPGVDAARLHRITRGNAFFISEVIAAGGEGVPATVRDAVLSRLAALSPDAREAVARLAVVPTRADRRLAELLSDDRPTALVEAERAGVLAGDAAHVWFRHEIARSAVLSTLTPGERVAAHRRTLDALLLDPAADRALIVHHARAGHRPRVLLEVGPAAAADAVRSGAQRSAAEILRAVLETGAVHDRGTMASLLAQRAYALYYLNLFEEAFDTATRAVESAEPTGDCRLLAETLSVLSKAAFWARGPHAARRAAEHAVALLDESGDDAARLSAALADLARAHSNLATVGIVSEPAAASVGFGERAFALADELGRDDLRCQALIYLGSSRLAAGDERGADDLERSIRLGVTDPRPELAVRACVNAAGGAYRRGRFADALAYVERGLRLAENGEFFGGQYRLRLTRSAILASAGRWDDAVAELRALLAQSGDPATMGSLARALLARLLARRGGAGAADVLDLSSARHRAAGDPYVGGPLAAAAVELAWLGGDAAAMPGLAAPALQTAVEAGHRGSRSELCRYLQRAGHAVEVPPDAIGPWAPALAGRPLEAAAAWHDLGERYEEAVELVQAGEPDRSRGLRALERLGAFATLETLRPRSAARQG